MDSTQREARNKIKRLHTTLNTFRNMVNFFISKLFQISRQMANHKMCNPNEWINSFRNHRTKSLLLFNFGRHVLWKQVSAHTHINGTIEIFVCSKIKFREVTFFYLQCNSIAPQVKNTGPWTWTAWKRKLKKVPKYTICKQIEDPVLSVFFLKILHQ